MLENTCINRETTNNVSSVSSNVVVRTKNAETNYYVTSNDSFESKPYIIILPNDINIFRDINISAESIPVESQRELISLFIVKFQRIILRNRELLNHSGNFPPLLMHSLSDGSILIEWIFPDFRIGFSFELIKEESSWYLVANKHLKEISSSGLLDFTEIDELLINLLNFATSNL